MSKTAIVSLVKVEATLQKQNLTVFLGYMFLMQPQPMQTVNTQANPDTVQSLLPRARPLEQWVMARQGQAAMAEDPLERMGIKGQGLQTEPLLNIIKDQIIHPNKSKMQIMELLTLYI